MNTAPRERETPEQGGPTEPDDQQVPVQQAPVGHHLDPKGELKGLLVTQMTTQQGHRVLKGCQPDSRCGS